MKLDLVVHNAEILTGDPHHARAHTLGIWGGKIVGVDEEIDGHIASARRSVDAQGSTIVPGFNDVHAHSVWYGLTLGEIDLSACTTAEAIYDVIAAGAKKLAADQWVVASNFQALQLVGETIQISRLDAVSGGRPVVIKHNSGHSYTVNTQALRQAGIALESPEQPTGGHIVLDRDGQPTGLLEENAMRAVQEQLEPESLAHLSTALTLALREYAKQGITSVTDAGIAGGWIGHSPREFAAYQQVRDAGDLIARVQTMITHDVLHPLDGHPDDPVAIGMDAGIRTGVGDEWLQIGPTKIFTDGSLIGTTAAMTENYCGCTHNRGYFQGDPDEMLSSVVKAAAAGWSLALHAIGDAAVDLAIKIIDNAVSRYGQPVMPHRIEHGGVVRNDQLEALRRLNVVVVPQPRFLAEFGDKIIEKLGPERALLSYPGKRLLDAGLILPGSSDRPVADGTPLKVIQAFVERLTESGRDLGVDERITVEEALKAYTQGSAAATGWGGRKGQLMEGQFADLVFLGDNPLTVDSARIGGIEVMATLAGGAFTHGETHVTGR